MAQALKLRLLRIALIVIGLAFIFGGQLAHIYIRITNSKSS